MFLRTVYGVKMNGFRQWLAAAVLHTLLLTVASNNYHRRSSGSRSLPISKGGWRPVVGSSGYVFGGNYAVTPSHYNNYRIPLIDTYQSSLRPFSTRDATKLTSIAQSYHPTTLRTVSTAPPTPYHQQIQNTYHYQYPLPHPSLTKYKHVNYPSENVVIKNAYDPYSAKPLIPKYNSKYNIPLQSSLLQPIHIQPFHYSQHPGALDVFGKAIQVYIRPNGSKPHSSGTEIYKPEVYKLPDSEPAPQSVSQQVKTAQQQNLGVTPKASAKPVPQYLFQDISSNIIGPFNTFGVQSLQGRDPIYPTTKTTYLPPQQTKQTIFNSFSYTPNYKNNYGVTTYSYNNIPTQQTPVTFDSIGNQGTFKASPQDPFIKQQQSVNLGSFPATTYNPVFQSTTLANNYNGYGFPPHQQPQVQTFYDHQIGHEKKKQKIHDSLAAGINEQAFHFVSPPKKAETENPKVVPFRAAYEVTETYYEDDSISGFQTTKPPMDNYSSQKTDELVTTEEYRESIGKLTTMPITVLPEEYAFIPESDDVNSLNYDGQLETQSRRPLGDDFEPVRKQKLKDYYYKVSPPSQVDNQPNRVKKPIEATKATAHQDLTTSSNINKDNSTDTPLEALPTLPPNKHFKRPSTPDPNGRDKTRKRNKLRRRRPLADKQLNKEETNTPNRFSSSTESTSNINFDESEKRRPSRVRPNKGTADLTTLSTTIELTTSALPTVAPTNPTVVRKKLIHRRPVTTPASKQETTAQSTDYSEYKESPVMKISEAFNLNILPVENKATERPDYSHKQDEKDTPTSDIAVLTNKQKNDASNVQSFSFHRDSKPIEAKLEPVKNNYRETTTEENANEISATTSHVEYLLDNKTKNETRPKTKNKHENNRPRFSIKDYRNRLSSTTTTTEKSADTYISRVRFPLRKSPYENTNTENETTTTERKKFTPKEPRYKHVNVSDNNEGTEKSHKYTRQPGRQRQTAADTGDVTTHKISSRIRNGSRRPKPTEEITENSSPAFTTKKTQRKKVNDSELEESVQDISVTEIPLIDINPKEKPNSESAIMKIADKKHHQDPIEHIFEHTKRVSDLTLAASKDYNKLGLFKNVSNNSRRIPNYFTIATDDPILPIEAFFPQLNQRKDS